MNISQPGTSSNSRAQSPIPAFNAQTKYYKPYFTPSEIEYLSEKQRGKQSATQEEKTRQSACTFIEAMGARIGFPRKTIATAQMLYHRFHLFFPRKDFNYHDVSLAVLFVSTKMQDTLKKPRDLMSVSYSIRFPELAAKSKHPTGDIDLDTMDPQVVADDRQRLLGIERLVLETICFNFIPRMPFQFVIKLGKLLGSPRRDIQLAWRLSIDCYRTLLPLLYPPHVLALGSIYVSTLLLTFEQPPPPPGQEPTSFDIAATFAGWDTSQYASMLHCSAADLEDFAHAMLDLLGQYCQNPSANTSPSTPSSPSPHLSHRERHALNQQSISPYRPDQLLRLKIALREHEHLPRTRHPWDSQDPSDTSYPSDGKAPVRFSFFPSGFDR